MPTTTYSSPNGLMPSRDPQEAFTDAVRLVTGSYSQGQAIGEFTGRTAANEVQTITVTGTPTGGTFRLAFNGVPTAAITYSTTDATLQANILAALVALPQVGTGNVAVVSSSSGTSIAVTFQGTLAALNQPMITLFSNSLTGGTSPTMTVAETTAGHVAGVQYGGYDDALSNGLQTCRGFLKYAVDVLPDGTVQGPANGPGSVSSEVTATVYFTGTFYTATPAGALALPGLDANGVADVGRMIVGTTSILTTTGSELRLN